MKKRPAASFTKKRPAAGEELADQAAEDVMDQSSLENLLYLTCRLAATRRGFQEVRDALATILCETQAPMSPRTIDIAENLFGPEQSEDEVQAARERMSPPSPVPRMPQDDLDFVLRLAETTGNGLQQDAMNMLRPIWMRVFGEAEQAPAPPKVAAPAAKRRRLGAKGPAVLILVPPRSFSKLSGRLIAEVASFLDLHTKLRAMIVVDRVTWHGLNRPEAWDPFVINSTLVRPFLRLLKTLDPSGIYETEVPEVKQHFPTGFFEVTHLDVVLMDPERVEIPDSDTEDDRPRPSPLQINDPLDEITKRLRFYFTELQTLRLSNIEYRMDFRFLSLREDCLSRFGHVELTWVYTAPTSGYYKLVALRDVPPMNIDPVAMMLQNRQRVPHNVQYNMSTTLTEREALYLAEHRMAYKNGREFRLIHAYYRELRSHVVRKRYKPVVANLRKRFPDRFPPEPPAPR